MTSDVIAWLRMLAHDPGVDHAIGFGGGWKLEREANVCGIGDHRRRCAVALLRDLFFEKWVRSPIVHPVNI